MTAAPPQADPFAEPDDDELLTDWERGFLASIDAWYGEPTEAQQAKLDEIEESLPIRRRRKLTKTKTRPAATATAAATFWLRSGRWQQ